MPDLSTPPGQSLSAPQPDAVAPADWSAIVTDATLPPEARWRRLLAALPAHPAPAAVAALDQLLDQQPGLPSWVRKAPAPWRRALLAGQPVPWFPILRVLDLRRLRLRDDGLVALALRSELGAITHIKLYDNAIGNRGLTALVNNAALRQVAVLNLSRNRIGSAGVQSLTQTACLPALRELYLGRNWLGDRGAAILAAAPAVQQLTFLDVRDNALSAAGKELLARSPYLQGCRVRGLDLA